MDTSDNSRQSVNGKFNRLSRSFDGENEHYENFLTKKGRERGKERKELRESGLSRKDARKQALAKIPKDKLKEIRVYTQNLFPLSQGKSISK